MLVVCVWPGGSESPPEAGLSLGSVWARRPGWGVRALAGEEGVSVTLLGMSGHS